MIRHLTRNPDPRPWLLCVTRRPQGDAIAKDVDGHVLLELQPLAGDAAQSLALAAAGELALSGEALDAVRERSGGNPLFVRELVAAARDAGSADTLPETVETLITSRIDTLSPEDRFLLRNASVLGARFELDVLAEVVGDELDDVADLGRWDRLAEFVAWEDAGVLRFVHDLFRAVSYEGLSYRRRREVHALVGDALERREAAPAILSLHFREAARDDKAWHYAVLAGDQARAQFANVVAAELYERALAAAQDLPGLSTDDVARVCEALGDVAELFADYEKAATAYMRARRQLASDDPVQARLMLKEGNLRERLGRYTKALHWYGRGLKAVEGDGDAGERARLEVAYAGVKFRQARYDDAIIWCERAAADAQAADDRSTLAHAYYIRDAVETHLGHSDPTWCEQALAIFEEIGDALGAGKVLNNLGIHAYYAGRWDEALDFYARSREQKERAGDVVSAALQTNNEAEILLDQGHFERAGELFNDALRVSRAAGYALGEAFVTANLARVAARTGRYDEAHALFDDAVARLTAIGSEGLALEVEARRAECLVLEGRHKEAAKLATDAIARAETLGRLGSLGPLLERSLGYAVHQARQPAKARPHFEESLRLARAAETDYEVALTLRALALTGAPEHAAEAGSILERLGVVATPEPPLP